MMMRFHLEPFRNRNRFKGSGLKLTIFGVKLSMVYKEYDIAIDRCRSILIIGRVGSPKYWLKWQGKTS